MGIFKEIIDYISKLFTWWVIVMPWEQGIRVRFGKHITLLDKGVYLKLPLLDSIYVQEKRLRTITLPIQTLTTKDGHTITVSSSVGYSIVNISKLFNTLYMPDMTIGNIAMGKMSDFICNNNLIDCIPETIENNITNAFTEADYGLKFERIKLTTFANVRTYRLINGEGQLWEGLDLKLKK